MSAEIPRRGFLGLAAAAAAGSVVPWMTGPPAAQAHGGTTRPMDPDWVLADLKAGNQRYAAGSQEPSLAASTNEDFTWGQAPRAVVLGLGDFSVSPEIIFDQPREDLFVMGVPGSGVNEHALASVEYATAALGTRLVLILGQGWGGGSDFEESLAAAQASAGQLSGADPLLSKSVAAGQVKILAGLHDLATGKVEILR